MRRRDVIALLGAAALAAPHPAGAQPAGVRRIGLMLSLDEHDPEMQSRLAAFRQGLVEQGLAEGRNLRIDYRWPGNDAERMRADAKELIELRPELLLAVTTPLVTALMRETRTIPIVFVAASDPVGSGFIASFARPGGNVTGFTNLEPSMAGKWIEFLKDLVPGLARVSFLFNPDTAPFSEF
jgi:putative ABC transport system substrate-binding protein